MSKCQVPGCPNLATRNSIDWDVGERAEVELCVPCFDAYVHALNITPDNSSRRVLRDVVPMMRGLKREN